MDLIREQRETIIKENNTAQDRLKEILENLPKSSEVLEISEKGVLHGDLDFAVLQEMGMGNLTSIILGEGDVTSIMGLPSNLKKLECVDNLLVDLENLPTTLEVLNISHNYVEKIDDNRIYIGANDEQFDFYYTVFAERIDVDKLIVEYLKKN